jgi:hypothetical protein
MVTNAIEVSHVFTLEPERQRGRFTDTDAAHCHSRPPLSLRSSQALIPLVLAAPEEPLQVATAKPPYHFR